MIDVYKRQIENADTAVDRAKRCGRELHTDGASLTGCNARVASIALGEVAAGHNGGNR